MSKVRGLGEIVLCVHDIEKSLQFGDLGEPRGPRSRIALVPM